MWKLIVFVGFYVLIVTGNVTKVSELFFGLFVLICLVTVTSCCPAVCDVHRGADRGVFVIAIDSMGEWLGASEMIKNGLTRYICWESSSTTTFSHFFSLLHTHTLDRNFLLSLAVALKNPVSFNIMFLQPNLAKDTCNELVVSVCPLHIRDYPIIRLTSFTFYVLPSTMCV